MPEYKPDYDFFSEGINAPLQGTSSFHPDIGYFSEGMNRFYLEDERGNPDPDNTISKEEDRSDFWDSMPYVYKKAYNDFLNEVISSFIKENNVTNSELQKIFLQQYYPFLLLKKT